MSKPLKRKKTVYLPVVKCSKEYKEQVEAILKKEEMTYAEMVRYAFARTYQVQSE